MKRSIRVNTDLQYIMYLANAKKVKNDYICNIKLIFNTLITIKY